MQSLVNALNKYINSVRKLWWSLWLLESPVPYVDEALDVIQKIRICNPTDIKTFKYAVNLLYYSNLFRSNKKLRDELLIYIKSFTPANDYAKNEVAKFIEIFAFDKKRVWWTLWLFKVRALSPAEQCVINSFKREDFEGNLQLRKLKTDPKILAIANDIHQLSAKVYQDIPKIDQRISEEILRISDDINGLAKITEIVDSQVPLILTKLREEVSKINKQLEQVTTNTKNNFLHNPEVYKKALENKAGSHKITATNLAQTQSKPVDTTKPQSMKSASTEQMQKKSTANIAKLNANFHKHDENHSIFEITIRDPKQIHKDSKVVIDRLSRTLFIEGKVFYLSSNTGLQDLKNYLISGRPGLVPVTFNQIVNKFMTETSVTKQLLDELGMKLV